MTDRSVHPRFASAAAALLAVAVLLPAHPAAAGEATAPAGVPGRPGALRMVTNDRQAAITWAPAAPNGSPVTGYKIWIRSFDRVTGTYSPFTVTTLGPTARQQVWTNLLNLRLYDVRIAALNRFGSGPQRAALKEVKVKYPITGPQIALTPIPTALDAALTRGRAVKVQMAGRGAIPTRGAKYVAVTIIITTTPAGGRLWLWADGRPRPILADIGQLAPSTTQRYHRVVPVGATGAIRVVSSADLNATLRVTAYTRR